MFKVFQIMIMSGKDIVIPFVLSVILFLMYADIQLSLIVFLSTIVGYKIVSAKRYESLVMWASPFIIIAVSLFLTCHYLTGMWFWIAFVVLIMVTIAYGFFMLVFRSLNIQ